MVEELRAFDARPDIQEILVLHDEDTVVTKLVVKFCESVVPLGCPLLRAVCPSTSPLGPTPGVAYLEETLSSELDSFDHCISMTGDDSADVW